MSGRRIYVDCRSPFYRAAYTEDGRLSELILEDKNNTVLPGNIYIGRIERVMPSGFAFVDIGEKEPVFMQLGPDNTIRGSKVKGNTELPVQVIKEGYDEKRAVVSADISRNGKYCVVIDDGKNSVGISAKITDAEKRKMLSDCVKDVSDEYSIVVRTAGKDAEPSAVTEEARELCSEMRKMLQKAEYTKAPALLYREDSPLFKLLRDIGGEDCAVLVNDERDFKKIKERYSDTELYTGDIPLFMNFGIEKEVNELFRRKIWLKSGGYIVIDETEAMTVIDVNSGKAQNVDRLFNINCEAAKEAARQIRLRNLSGMIIIDFINMKSKEEKERLYFLLKDEIKKDRVRSHIVGMTELGLMQLTRQKIRKPLSRYIYHTCPMCGGLGAIKEKELVADDIISHIINILSTGYYNEITLSANAQILETARPGIEALEEKYNAKIRLKCINTSRFDWYETEKSRI